MAKSKYEYVKDFEKLDKCLPSTYIVCRVDGQNFHKFSSLHDFNKPNDINALYLMNEAALSVMSDYPDIVMSYGQSDEYSFVFRKNTTIFERRESKISTTIAAKFASSYTFYWSNFFPDKPMKYPPSFDSRIVLYPSENIVRDYLSWRQADCHINNLYNTCYWKMVLDEGKLGNDVEKELKETNASSKNEILFHKFGINYNNEADIFRKGSVLVRRKRLGATEVRNTHPTKLVSIMLFHGDIIGDKFWVNNPSLLTC